MKLETVLHQVSREGATLTLANGSKICPKPSGRLKNETKEQLILHRDEIVKRLKFAHLPTPREMGAISYRLTKLSPTIEIRKSEKRYQGDRSLLPYMSIEKYNEYQYRGGATWRDLNGVFTDMVYLEVQKYGKNEKSEESR